MRDTKCERVEGKERNRYGVPGLPVPGKEEISIASPDFLRISQPLGLRVGWMRWLDGSDNCIAQLQA